MSWRFPEGENYYNKKIQTYLNVYIKAMKMSVGSTQFNDIKRITTEKLLIQFLLYVFYLKIYCISCTI